MNILGIDIGGTKTSVCVGDAHGKIFGSRRMPTREEDGADAWFGRLKELTAGMLAEAGVDEAKIAAVGVAAPGPLSVKRGLLLSPPNMPRWVDVPIQKMLDARFPCPVYMDNDANACALAEWYFGEFAGVQHLVYLTMSTGLGGGIIANGRLVQGATDLAGEVGFHVLDLDGPVSPCGHRGSFEAFCGGRNLALRLRDRIKSENIQTALLDKAGGNPDAIDFKAFVEAVRDGDDFARREWEIYIERLAQGIGNLIMILNPQAIVLGTIAIHAGDLLLEPLRQVLPRFVVKPALDACRIAPSKLGPRIGDLSALAVAIAALSEKDRDHADQ
ncbi:MAG: ROK family protein [Kiritimatiellae bacterium]|nr:ROK family protein [Kiritimatiellia bacterium]